MPMPRSPTVNGIEDGKNLLQNAQEVSDRPLQVLACGLHGNEFTVKAVERVIEALLCKVYGEAKRAHVTLTLLRKVRK